MTHSWGMKDQDEIREAVQRKARVLHVGYFIAGNLSAYFEAGTFKDKHGGVLPEPVIGIDEHRFLATPALIYELSSGLDVVFEMVSGEMDGVIKRVIGFGASQSLDPGATIAVVVSCLRGQILALHGVDDVSLGYRGSDEFDASQG